MAKTAHTVNTQDGAQTMRARQSEQRARSRLSRASRMRLLPYNSQQFQRVMSALVLPLRYGHEVAPLSESHRKLAKEIREVIWRTARPSTHWGSALTMILPGHALDPAAHQHLTSGERYIEPPGQRLRSRGSCGYGTQTLYRDHTAFGRSGYEFWWS